MLRPRTLSFVFIAALALLLGVWAGLRVTVAPVELRSGVLLREPRALPDFTLTDQDQRPFTRDSLAGRWTLVFAGYTYCPDVCPATLALLKALGPELKAAPRVVFLSVDPGRDTPERLRSYVRAFDPSFVGVTGTAGQLDAFTRALGIAYIKVPDNAGAGYTVDHSAVLTLLDPQGRIAAYFQPPLKLETLAADLGRAMGAAPPGCAGLELDGAWIRTPPPGAGMLAGYATLRNAGTAPVSVTGIDSDAFGSTSLHQTVVEQGVSRMLEAPLPVLPPGDRAQWSPGGHHLMLMEPRRELHAGDRVKVGFACGATRREFWFTVGDKAP